MSNIPGAFAQMSCPCCFKPGIPLCAEPGDLTTAQKLTALRGLMQQRGLDAYLVPSEDAHGSEYVSACDERRRYLCGFTGSAGTAVVTQTAALVWTDSRYFQQAAEQLKETEWLLMKAYEPGVPELQNWLAANLPSGAKVGVDPTVLDASKARAWKAEWATCNPNHNNDNGIKDGMKGAAAVGASGSAAASIISADAATSTNASDGNGSSSSSSASGTAGGRIDGAASGGPELVGVPGDNFVDLLWGSRRPPVPRHPIAVHPDMYAGETVASKVVRVREAMVEAGCAVLVVTALDQVAWLFNLRGSDIACNPVFFAYALVGTYNRVSLFLGRGTGSSVSNNNSSSNGVDGSSKADSTSDISSSSSGDVDWSWLGSDVVKEMADSNVTLRPYHAFESDLAQLVRLEESVAGAAAARQAAKEGGAPQSSSARTTPIAVLVDKGCCSLAVEAAVEASGARMVEADVSPVQAFKARKNGNEMDGIRAAALRDSAALVAFLAEIEDEVSAALPSEPHASDSAAVSASGSNASDGSSSSSSELREHRLGERLKAYREAVGGYRGDSFETISSVGANAAIIHYKPTPGQDALLTKDVMYLLDTGGQYVDGTTDVTRTMYFGDHPSEDQKRAYTRVLQGHAAMANAIFPSGTPGIFLDAMARAPLWQDGLTYGHGTGHGIGAYLNVHEGPMGIGGGSVSGNVIRKTSRMLAYYLEPIEAGMYVSDEPGFYREGEWGVRIESDLLVVPAENLPYATGNRPFLKFDYVTKVPMCQALIDASLLSPAEVTWLNAYHADCAASLKPLLKKDARALEWLQRHTKPLGAH